MATVRHTFGPADFVVSSIAAPQFKAIAGGGTHVSFVLAFDAAAVENATLVFRAANYGSGNLTLNIAWYADSASSGDVIWLGAVGAITPNTDTQDFETKAVATTNAVTDSHLGTTGQRLHECTITISNLDSIAAGDWMILYLARNANDGGDTMTGDAMFVGAELTYSDT